MDTITINIPSNLKFLHVATTSATQICSIIGKEKKLDAEFAANTELAVSEACTNAIKYKSPDLPDMEVIICFQILEDCLYVLVKDRNKEFAIDLPEPDFSKSSPGGYGIYIIKRIMDKVSYRREDGWNILWMSKHYKSLISKDCKGDIHP